MADHPEAGAKTRGRWTVRRGFVLAFLAVFVIGLLASRGVDVTALWVVWLVAVLGPPLIRWVRRHWDAGARNGAAS